MKKSLTTLAAIAFVGAMSSAAFAGPVGRFDNGYLDEHPEVAHQLGGNPGLADNAQFLATHPGLDQYLSRHPEVRTDLQQHPYRFMSDEWRHDRREWNGAHPLASTDRYMDSHPDVAGQLERNPGLVDNHEYIENHPGLREYLHNHPVARRDWRSHPYRYIAAERHYDKKH
ncbi:MAG TPA: hypothetical protein VE243_10655 [Candidatus Acidoferrum sp.]|nr:hypothetical protein [Candidatus Acidoferrum sp.]